jgi:hypothetical protein
VAVRVSRTWRGEGIALISFATVCAAARYVSSSRTFWIAPPTVVLPVNTAYFVRTDELGWTPDESETWLNEILTQTLLAHQTQASAPATNP